MRALVSLVVVGLVGFAVAAHSAAAGSGPPKKPDPSVSLNLGPASVTADASTDGTGASVDVSTPSASVDTTASTGTGVSATVDASTPSGEATAQASASTAGAVVPVRVDAKTSTPVRSATVQAGTKKNLDASIKLKTPVAANNAVTTGSRDAGTTRHMDAASPVPSNEGSPGIVGRPTEAGTAAPARRAVPHPTGHRKHVVPSTQTKVPLTKAVGSALTASAPLPEVAGRGTERVSGAVTHAPSAASAWRAPDRGRAPASPGGALGSGLPAAAFFAILSALLMLVAPLVGRWLWPAIGLVWQPAFASLPERPG